MAIDLYSGDRLNHRGPYKHYKNVHRGDGATLSDLSFLFGEEAVRVDVALVPAQLEPRQLIAAPEMSHLVGVYIRSESFDEVIGPNEREERYLKSPPFTTVLD